jgi:predicted nucleic acid-binding protein
MISPIKVFLDTNLLVDYLILSNIKGRRKKELKERYKNSFDLVKRIIKNKNKRFCFITSSLSRAEIYRCLLNEYLCDLMYKKGIPVNCWEHEKWKEKLDEDSIKIIMETIESFTDKYICSEIGELKSKKILSVLDTYNPKVFTDLIMRFKQKTHDSIIISTAIENKCKYLVTRDNRLRKELKEKGYKKINLINPEEFNKLLR